MTIESCFLEGGQSGTYHLETNSVTTNLVIKNIDLSRFVRGHIITSLIIIRQIPR